MDLQFFQQFRWKRSLVGGDTVPFGVTDQPHSRNHAGNRGMAQTETQGSLSDRKAIRRHHLLELIHALPNLAAAIATKVVLPEIARRKRGFRMDNTSQTS